MNGNDNQWFWRYASIQWGRVQNSGGANASICPYKRLSLSDQLARSSADVAANVFLDGALEREKLLLRLNEERAVLVHEAISNFYAHRHTHLLL